MAFSPDGNFLAVGGCGTSLSAGLHSNESDPHLLLLDVSLNDMIQTACWVAGRNFTQAEWQQYFPTEDYRVTCPLWSSE